MSQSAAARCVAAVTRPAGRSEAQRPAAEGRLDPVGALADLVALVGLGERRQVG